MKITTNREIVTETTGHVPGQVGQNPAWAAAPEFSGPEKKHLATHAAFILVLGIAVPIIEQLPPPSPMMEAALRLGDIYLQGFAAVIAGLIFAFGWNAFDARRNLGFAVLALCFLIAALFDFTHIVLFDRLDAAGLTPEDSRPELLWTFARLVVLVGILGFTLIPSERWAGVLELGLALLIAGVFVVLVSLFLVWPDSLKTVAALAPKEAAIRQWPDYLFATGHLGAAAMAWRLRGGGHGPRAFYLVAGNLVFMLAGFCFGLTGERRAGFEFAGHTGMVIAFAYIYNGVFVLGIREPFRRMREASQFLTVLQYRFSEAERIGRTGWFDADLKQGKVSISPAFLKMAGLSRPEPFSAEELFALIEPEDLARLKEIVANAIGFRKRLYHEFRCRYGDGSLHWLHIEAEARLDEAGQVAGLLGSFQDITWQRAREQALRAKDDQLAEARKMESFGRLAGGIAHDFNNILAAILGFTHLLKQDLAAQPDYLKFLDRIETAGMRGRQMVEQILAFARVSNVERQRQDIRGLIQETADMLPAALPPGIAVSLDLDTEELPVLANGSQMQQIILNLCVNAADSYGGEPGEIRIKASRAPRGSIGLLGYTEMAQLDRAPFAMQVGYVAPGRDYIELSVQDWGSGMQADVLRQCLEPFFTTKPRTRGTGLGLAVVAGVIAAYEGVLRIDTTPDRAEHGTRIAALLPQAEAVAMPAQAGQGTQQETPRASGRLVLIDDEPDVLDATAPMLRRAGFEVAAFDHPFAAIRHVEANPEAVDAIVADMTMPGIDGVSLVKQLRPIAPATAFILCTGYGDAAAEAAARAAGARCLLAKPVAPERLRAELERALAERRAEGRG